MTLSADEAQHERGFDTRTLELPKILDMLAGHASFAAGRELAVALEPSDDPDEVRRRLRETAEARELLTLQPSLTMGGARDVRPTIDRAQLGGLLQPHELLDIHATVRVGRQWRSAFSRLRERLPTLGYHTDRIRGNDSLTVAIESAIDDSGEIADRASNKLRELRTQKRVAQDRLMTRLQAMIANSDIREALQDGIVTQRNGRYVLPVRAEMRTRVRGIVHDQSSSGATVFIEPLDLVDVGNRVRELDLEERDEVERILRELSVAVAAARPDLLVTLEMLANLDLARAKALLAEAMLAREPALNDTGRTRPALVLRDARHPLLGERAVPSTIELGQDFDVLLITGPNTGGKTVALKTVGLLALMGQCGMHLPTDEGSSIPVFRRIFADIGDEQSIEQSLSTFSGHVANIVRMMRNLSAPSLVLVDELGAGTDPLEGAALARAIIDRLRRPGILTIATSHYSELKTFANETPRVSNASVEFDVETLRPTYRLQIGLPGQSNALAIARRLGMPPEVLQAAEQNVGPQALRMEELLDEIQEERRSTEAERLDAQRERDAAIAALREAQQALADAERERSDVFERAAAEAQRELDAARREINRLLTSARRSGSQATELAQAAEELSQVTTPRVPRSARPVPPRPMDGPALRVGGSVRVRTLGAVGTVLGLDDNGNAEVEVGGMRVRTRTGDLQPLSRTERFREPSAVTVHSAATPIVSTELQLRGLRVDEALEQLDKYLHDAAMTGVPRARIVHGKGTGAIRRAVWDALAKHPLVNSFELASAEEGGAGVTVVGLGRI
jgi:DNA mismatch repair protein MutS2